MRPFDKIFNGGGKKYSASSDLMEEDKFWAMIQSSYENSRSDYEEQQGQLTIELRKLPLQDLISFDNRFRELRGRAYDWQLWAAIYIIHGGCGDDSFTDFRDWVISQGKEFYYKTISNPESLVEVENDKIEIEWEGMGYIPNTVFEEITGEEIPSTYKENMEIKGDEWEDDTSVLKSMFPILFAKYADLYND
jgi:hypothetical protein